MHAAAVAAAAACMRACAAACVIDTMNVSTDLHSAQTHMPGVEAPELVLRRRRARKKRQYSDTKIRFSTPGLSALLPLVGQIYL